MVQSTKSPHATQDLKQCTHCKQYKPRSEFYTHTHTTDGLNSWCKACKKANQNNTPSYVTTEPSTMLGIEILASVGIPAITGVGCGLRHVDLAAWGCVPVEVKTSQPKHNGGFSWAISLKQRKNGILGFLLLIADPDGERRVYVASTEQPWLYRQDGLPPRFWFKEDTMMSELARHENAFWQLPAARADYEFALSKTTMPPLEFVQHYWRSKLPFYGL